MTHYTHVLDLAREAEPPADGIMSRTVLENERLKGVTPLVMLLVLIK
jgi:hypothetical protein